METFWYRLIQAGRPTWKMAVKMERYPLLAITLCIKYNRCIKAWIHTVHVSHMADLDFVQGPQMLGDSSDTGCNIQVFSCLMWPLPLSCVNLVFIQIHAGELFFFVDRLWPSPIFLDLPVNRWYIHTKNWNDWALCTTQKYNRRIGNVLRDFVVYTHIHTICDNTTGHCDNIIIIIIAT